MPAAQPQPLNRSLIMGDVVGSGQFPTGTGLTNVGVPGGQLGLGHEDPSLSTNRTKQRFRANEEIRSRRLRAKFTAIEVAFRQGGWQWVLSHGSSLG